LSIASNAAASSQNFNAGGLGGGFSGGGKFLIFYQFNSILN
jgi:hypothetical protein